MSSASYAVRGTSCRPTSSARWSVHALLLPARGRCPSILRAQGFFSRPRGPLKRCVERQAVDLDGSCPRHAGAFQLLCNRVPPLGRVSSVPPRVPLLPTPSMFCSWRRGWSCGCPLCVRFLHRGIWESMPRGYGHGGYPHVVGFSLSALAPYKVSSLSDLHFCPDAFMVSLVVFGSCTRFFGTACVGGCREAGRTAMFSAVSLIRGASCLLVLCGGRSSSFV